jgi:uncharacterized protein (UPF0276 family)
MAATAVVAAAVAAAVAVAADIFDLPIRLAGDINNVHVSCFNHQWDAHEYLLGIPHERVRQIHLAGHVDRGRVKVDTHSEAVAPEVWALFRWYVGQYGPVPSMIERDSNIPTWQVLASELDKIEAILDQASAMESRCA